MSVSTAYSYRERSIFDIKTITFSILNMLEAFTWDIISCMYLNSLRHLIIYIDGIIIWDLGATIFATPLTRIFKGIGRKKVSNRTLQTFNGAQICVKLPRITAS